MLVRVLWAGLVIMALGLFVASLPLRWHELLDADPTTRAALEQLGFPLTTYMAYRLGLESILALGFTLVGGVIFWRRPDEWIALSVSLMLILFGTQVNAVALIGALPAWSVVIKALSLLGWSLLGIFLYTFPAGRFVPRWTVIPATVWIAAQVFWNLAPDSPFYPPNWPPPLFAGLLLVSWGGALVAQVYRYHSVSSAMQRQQTKWLVFGFGAVFLVALMESMLRPLVEPGVVYTLFVPPALALLYLIIPIAIGIAVLRYRLWDIDPIVNRTLVYGALTACVIAIYILVVAYLGAVFRTDDNLLISLAATGLVAVLFQPLRERLQRGVNRLMYGERDDPYAVLSRLGQRLESTIAPAAIPPAIVETLAQALKLPYAALALKHDDRSTIVAAYGTAVDDPLCLPLIYQAETVGNLLLAPRTPGEQFSSADQRLLEHIARQAGIAMHAVRITADLQRSRERLVTTREEERRRLRRDLHDGLGPALGGLGLKLEIVHDLVASDPTAASALIMKLQTETQAAVADIRRLIYDLRPPALDQLGLVGALRETAASYEQGFTDGRGPRITIEAPEQLPLLPAAVEVAVYRIAQEALTNVVRHAAARTCRVRLALDEQGGVLVVDVSDDGGGLPDPPGDGALRTGVGLQSMRERAAELGGVCVIEPSAEGGTCVRAALPCTPSCVGGTPASGDAPHGHQEGE